MTGAQRTLSEEVGDYTYPNGGKFGLPTVWDKIADQKLDGIQDMEKIVEALTDMDSSELIKYPEEMVPAIEKYGIVKLGEMELQDNIVINAFDGRPMLTMGSDQGEDLDWESMWVAELDKTRKTIKPGVSEAGWSEMVKVEAHVIRIKHAAGPPGVGILQPVLVRWQSKSTPLSVFGLPAMQAIMDYKWDKWAKKLLWIEFVVFMMWLICFIGFVVRFGNEDLQRLDSFADCWADEYGRITSIMLFSAVAFMSPFLVIELSTIYSYSWSWFQQFWNVIDVATYTFTLLALFVYLTRLGINSVWFSIMLATQGILMMVKIQYFSRVFATSKGSLVVDTIKVVLADVKWFLLFIFLTMFSFGIAFSILYRKDQDLDPTFSNMWHSVVSMFGFMLGGFDFQLFYMSSNPVAAVIFFLIYESLMAIMLLNLLIAIMTDSYSRVMEDERLWILCSKAQIIDELETTLPQFITRKWSPCYVHILKVGPRKNVNLDSLWTRLGLTESKLVSSTKEITFKLKDFEEKMIDKLNGITKEVDAIIAKKAL